MAVGIGACAVGARRTASVLFSVLGAATLVLGVLALITGSLTPLSLLVANMVVMWAIATVRPPAAGETIAHGPATQEMR